MNWPRTLIILLNYGWPRKVPVAFKRRFKLLAPSWQFQLPARIDLESLKCSTCWGMTCTPLSHKPLGRAWERRPWRQLLFALWNYWNTESCSSCGWMECQGLLLYLERALRLNSEWKLSKVHCYVDCQTKDLSWPSGGKRGKSSGISYSFRSITLQTSRLRPLH